MKTGINILILTFIFQTSFGQTDFELGGQLTDCADSSELILGFVHLAKKDSIIETTYTDDNGRFKFKGLKKGTYQLVSDYYYFPSTTLEINIPSDKNVNICLTADNPDSLLKDLKLRPTYTIYYYGLPIYSDTKLNEIGKKYGVKWQNLGCVTDDKVKKYNDMINRILTYRNGEGWKDKFWSEVKQKHK